MNPHTAAAAAGAAGSGGDRTTWQAGKARNWAGNVSFSASTVHRPQSVAELSTVVAGHRRVKAVGSGYSFSTVADTEGALVRLDRMPKVIEIDADRSRVRVAAGITFAELAPELHRLGFALQNLGSLPHITVAGACATGTHGSGNANPSIAAGVREVELVTADGSLARLDRSSPGFGGAVVSLGALGVATHLTLDLVPAYDVEQYVWEGLQWEDLLREVEAVTACAHSVSVFTDWHRGHSVWVKRRVHDPLPDLAFTGARPASGPRHPLAGLPAENCSPQEGVPGPWWERLPHFRADRLPSTGNELQSEYFVPLGRAREALSAVHALRDRIGPVLQLSELRTQAADEAWIGPGHGRDSLAVHFTWRLDVPGVLQVLPAVEAALAPFAPRPHWGKLFTVAPEALAARYPRWEDFRALRTALDPEGTFRNPLTDRYFG
ncbi:FAD-binding protein [Streptomyces sp. WAC06614]|uniref:FAD-binding protein n=1 Tax=Streptomyces sp. WAC06614 TaxID=2487416 RepID=UPI000F79C16E|nr:FAD-binding protein [Streptomyces sp. WAC06614]RSS83600.1 FAD-binding protein [Streptomyces sp. WAC06614]